MAGVLLSLIAILAAASCIQTSNDANIQVVMLGDSIFALSGEIANELVRLSGETYRDDYVSGAEMDGGFVKEIPDQHNTAVGDDSNLRTIIMDG